MRKHFLILMLLALLPFTAWADDPGVNVTAGGYTVNISKQIMTTAAAPTVNSVKQGSTDVPFTTIASYRYQTIGKKVNAVSAEGLYFLEVSLTGANTVLYVPFYVAGELNATLVDTEGEYNTSLGDGGAYWYYYQEWKRSDVWYRWNLTSDDTEANGVLLYPGDVPAPTSGNPAQVDITHRLDPESSNYNQDANAWYDGLKTGAYKNNISHSWWAAKASKPANYAFSFHTAAATEAWKVAVVYNGVEKFPWGDRVFGSQEGQKHYGLFSVAGPVLEKVDIYHEFGVTPTEFVESKFKMYLIPATLPAGVEAPVVSNVEVTLDPNVINVLYPDNVGGIVPAVKASDFSIQAGSTFPTGIKDAAEAKASLIASEILKIQTVEDKPIPALLGSVKYYFDIDQDKLAASVWAGATIHMAKNGDLNVVARPLSHETVEVTADPADAAYDAESQTYKYEFNATERQPKPIVKVGDIVLDENQITYSWTFNKNVNNVAGANEEAGIPTVTISAKAGTGYTGTTTFPFTITPKTFYDGNTNVVSINGLTAKTYNRGLAITQDFTVADATLTGYSMEAGRDYLIDSWANNENATVAPTTTLANQASVTIIPTGNYTTKAGKDNTAIGRFVINPKSINEADIVFDGVQPKTYNYGAELTQDAPALKWKYNDGQTDQYEPLPNIFKYTYVNNKNVGTATITATIKTDAEIGDNALIAAAKNYTSNKNMQFYIQPRKLTDVAGLVITVAAAEYNDGLAVKPAITVTRTVADPQIEDNTLKEGIDFEIPLTGDIQGWANNINVTTTNPAVVTIIGKGNFAAVNEQGVPVSISKEFQIAQKAVKVNAVGGMTKAYGTLKNNFGFTYTNNVTSDGTTALTMEQFIAKFGGKVDYTAWSNEDTPTAAGEFNLLNKGTYKVRATWEAYNADALTPEVKAQKEEAGLPYDTDEQVANRANYNFAQTANEYGTFTIAAAALTIKPQNAEKYYGVADDPGLTFKVFSGDNDVTDQLDWNVAGATKPLLARETGTNAKDYVISVSNAPVLPNYELTYTATAKFTIKPFPITITANAQSVLFGTEPNLNAEYNQMVRKVKNVGTDQNPEWVDGYDDYITTVDITPTQLANQQVIDRVNDLHLTLKWDKTIQGEDGVYAGALVPVINSTNYVATIVPGTLTIKNDAPAITLVRVAKADINDTDKNTAAAYIAQYDTKKVTVNIKFNDDDAYNTLKPNKWYAMILPFKTTAKQISDAFGYAIVDLLNTANTNEHRTLFSLHMSTEVIPANTPFIVKVWDKIDMNATGVTFNGVTIEAPEAYDEIAVSDAAGNKFIGSYTGIDGLGAFKPEYSGHVTWWSLKQDAQYDNKAITATNTAYLRQLSAFSYIPGDLAAHEIVIEELGGGTTVIRNLNADAQTFSGEGWYNLNGVKLQSVPAEKGVYIHNGKKIVIK